MGQLEAEVLVGNPVFVRCPRQWALGQGRDNDYTYGFETHHKIEANVLPPTCFCPCISSFSSVVVDEPSASTILCSPPPSTLTYHYSKTVHQHSPLLRCKIYSLLWINASGHPISLNDFLKSQKHLDLTCLSSNYSISLPLFTATHWIICIRSPIPSLHSPLDLSPTPPKLLFPRSLMTSLD